MQTANVVKKPRIHWTEDERNQVFSFLIRKGITADASNEILKDGVQKAITQTGARNRPMGDSALQNERVRFKEWVDLRNKQTQERQEKQARLAPPVKGTKQKASPTSKSVKRPGPVTIIRPAKEEQRSVAEICTSVPVAPPPPLTVPSARLEYTIPSDLEAAVRKIVSEEHQKTLVSVREMLAEHRSQVRALVDGLHDSLMGYWEPNYVPGSKRVEKSTEQSSILSETVIEQTQRKTERPKAKRVLVVSNNDRRLAPLRDMFKELDFTFIAGENARQVDARGRYDAIVCTRFISHSTYEKLRQQYPDRVYYAKGSTGAVERMIREKIAV